MEDEYVNEVRIIGARCTTQGEIHAYLKKRLGLPEHYGANLSALADCLSEMCVRTHFTVAINEADIEPGMQAYVMRLVQTIAREAVVNDNLTVSIEHPHSL